MLTVTDLRVEYQGVAAVTGVSLSLSEGELVSLVGSNGAGKSSVLAAIAGPHRPIGGTAVASESHSACTCCKPVSGFVARRMGDPSHVIVMVL